MLYSPCFTLKAELKRLIHCKSRTVSIQLVNVGNRIFDVKFGLVLSGLVRSGKGGDFKGDTQGGRSTNELVFSSIFLAW